MTILNMTFYMMVSVFPAATAPFAKSRVSYFRFAYLIRPHYIHSPRWQRESSAINNA